jgi:hypothetical protein
LLFPVNAGRKPDAPEKTVVVTVPNPNGSYIPVTLQKYSDGYVRPNGEFSPDYPTIDQLKAMHSKASAIAERPEPAEFTFDIPTPTRMAASPKSK